MQFSILYHAFNSQNYNVVECSSNTDCEAKTPVCAAWGSCVGKNLANLVLCLSNKLLVIVLHNLAIQDIIPFIKQF